MTSSDKQRRLWDWYFGDASEEPARFERSVYGGTNPSSVFTLYGDGGGFMGMPFSTIDLDTPVSIGGRVWMPSINPDHTPQVKIMLWDGLDITQPPAREVTVATVLGWTEAQWAPFALVNGVPFAVGYQFVGSAFSPNFYVHSPNERVAGTPKVSPDGGLQITGSAMFNAVQTGDTVSYGIDAIVVG